MPQLDLFDEPTPRATRLGLKLHALAERGTYFGASSWKYEGWLGSVYSAGRYASPGRPFSKTKFDAECLREYAETFPSVCGDFTFYQFPSDDTWRKLFDETPASFRFAFKVPEHLTVVTWPNHARYGKYAGHANPDFLDVDRFREGFAGPLRAYRDRVATLIFEFGTFPRKVFPDAGTFLERLDPFLGALPEGFRYAIEIRNAGYLRSDYFAALSAHNVAHVFNAWDRMPSLADQAAMPGAFTADFTVARALMQPGRSYDDSVEKFRPFDRVREPDEAGRDALRRIALRSLSRREPAFLFVGNRFEGHSPGTIEAVAAGLET